MYLLTKPNEERISAFIDAQSRLTFTYSSVGTTNEGKYPKGYMVDHVQIQLGAGQAMFDAARRALRNWDHCQLGWIELHRPKKDLAAGQTVGVLAHALGLWILNACRIVYIAEEERKFAFAYGTLPDHAESGEERFQIEWREDDSVWYDLLAFSRPNQLFSRIGYPYVRRKQKQFARDSMLAMKSAIS